MFLENAPWYDDIRNLIGTRTVQTIIISLCAMIFCQLIKLITFSIKEKKLYVKALFTTGGMPSSHTAGVVALTTAVGFTAGVSTYIFAISFVFSVRRFICFLHLLTASSVSIISTNRHARIPRMISF